MPSDEAKLVLKRGCSVEPRDDHQAERDHYVHEAPVDETKQACALSRTLHKLSLERSKNRSRSCRSLGAQHFNCLCC